MTFAQIDDYLKAYGVNLKKPTSAANSKFVYSRELLSDESESLIISIADELDIPHPHTATDSGATVVANFWLPLHFRLFLSHLSSFKKTTVQLQQLLRPYGISTFVAHVDIEPTKEWQDEIGASLISMDALAAILMPGLKESNWTDQEVGAAIGRGILVVPVIRGIDPYGFLSRPQGISTKDKSVAEVAASIYKALMTSPKSRNEMVPVPPQLCRRLKRRRNFVSSWPSIDCNLPLARCLPMTLRMMTSRFEDHLGRLTPRLHAVGPNC